MLAQQSADTDFVTRIADLEAENARLRARGLRARRFSWRTFGAAVCIVVAAALVPVSVISAWTRAELTDESRFVETFAPLAGDPAIQSAVTEAVVTLIDEQVDIDTTTDALFDSIEELGLSDRAIVALEVLRDPAAAGVHSLIQSGVSTFVSSDLFAEVWTTALRESHRALIAAVTPGASDAALVIDGSGHVSIQLAPIIEQVKTHLITDGVSIASQIPPVDVVFVVAEVDALALISPVYTLATSAGYIVPALSVALFAAGVALARHRRRAVIGVGVGLAAPAALLLAAAAVGSSALIASSAGWGVPPDAVAAVYEQIIGRIRQTATAVLIVGVAATLVAAMLASTRIRLAMAGVNARVRSAAGIDRGVVGRWRVVLREQRAMFRVAITVLAVAVIALGPFHAAGITITITLALVAWWALAILEAPSHPSP